ncbi:hypothetical protein SCUCBS95973_002384 [Sporothrix curviconia]|uniref:Uncharacterized protein n=1 Tax=Sporothrix curviconia TaxID=1260050 RepID=A0ABP0B6F9_9PEZI
MANPPRVYCFPDNWHVDPDATPAVGSVISSIEAFGTTLLGPDYLERPIVHKSYPGGAYNVPRESSVFASFLAAQLGTENSHVSPHGGSSACLTYSGFDVYSWDPTSQDLKAIAKAPQIVQFAGYLDDWRPKYVYAVTAVRVASNMRVRGSGNGDDADAAGSQYNFGIRVKRLELKKKEKNRVEVKDKGDYTRGGLYEDNVEAEVVSEPDEYDIEVSEDSWQGAINGTTVEADGGMGV